MTTSKAKPADRATPTIHKPTTTDAQKVNVTRDTTTAAKQSAGWATAQPFQAAVAVWNKAADDIDANALVLSGLRAQLKLANAKQLVVRRAWSAARKQVYGTLDVQCAGSADDVKAFGFDPIVRVQATLPNATPGPIVTKAGTLSGEVVISWPKGTARHGFLVQTATDAGNPASYSVVIACTKTKLTIDGFTPGAHVFVRVAAVDPSSKTGQTAWTAWVSATAR